MCARKKSSRWRGGQQVCEQEAFEQSQRGWRGQVWAEGPQVGGVGTGVGDKGHRPSLATHPLDSRAWAGVGEGQV